MSPTPCLFIICSARNPNDMRDFVSTLAKHRLLGNHYWKFEINDTGQALQASVNNLTQVESTGRRVTDDHQPGKTTQNQESFKHTSFACTTSPCSRLLALLDEVTPQLHNITIILDAIKHKYVPDERSKMNLNQSEIETAHETFTTLSRAVRKHLIHCEIALRDYGINDKFHPVRSVIWTCRTWVSVLCKKQVMLNLEVKQYPKPPPDYLKNILQYILPGFHGSLSKACAFMEDIAWEDYAEYARDGDVWMEIDEDLNDMEVPLKVKWAEGFP